MSNETLTNIIAFVVGTAITFLLTLVFTSQITSPDSQRLLVMVVLIGGNIFHMAKSIKSQLDGEDEQSKATSFWAHSGSVLASIFLFFSI